MPASDIELFNFYSRYKWARADFENFQTWLYATIESAREGGGAGILKGFIPALVSGMQLRFPAGIAINSAGRLCLTTAISDVTFATPVGNPARSLVVLRPVDTDANDISEPLDPTNLVPLNVVRTATVMVLDGTAAASPAYPAITTGDIILAGLLIPAATVTITLAMIETYKRDIRRQRELRVRHVVASSDVDPETDDIIEVDDSAGNVTLTMPTAALMGQRKVTILKVAGSNTTTISGTISSLVNPEVDLGSAWTIYGSGTAFYKF